MKSKTKLGLIVIFLIMINFTIMVSGLGPQDQTVSIAGTDDDGFVTETGIKFDTDLVTILDPSMDITAFLVFRDIEVNYWEPLTNATLRLHTASSLSFEANSSVTIYGVAQKRFDGFHLLYPVLSAPLTTAYVNVNTSQFYGSQWFEINITCIIEELIRDPYWDGDGWGGGGQTDHIGLIIFGAEGSNTRHFYDYRANNEFEAELIIHWNHEPPPPSGDAVFNETNRGLNIWYIDNNGVNRTGEPPASDSVNWNKINMTQLTEIDSGNAFTLRNDTWVSVSELQGQSVGSFYNDTGSAGIRHFFSRFAFNVSAVTNTLPAQDILCAPTGISTATPVGGGGLSYGGSGDWAGIVMLVHQDDVRYRFVLKERAGVIDSLSDYSQYFNDVDNEILYFEFKIMVVDGVGGLFSYGIWSDPQYQNNIFWADHAMAWAINNFRYPQMIASLDSGTSRTNTGEYHTFLTDVLPENKTWIVTYPNGTIIKEDLDTYDDAKIFIDDELGPDPQDPDPPSEDWEQTGPFTRFKTRLYIFLMGFGMLMGPLMVFAYRRPTGYAFVIGLFVMLIGLGFLIHAGTV